MINTTKHPKPPRAGLQQLRDIIGLRARQIATVSFAVLTVLLPVCSSQTRPATSHGRNYDEGKVGSYTLPDPLIGKDGGKVTGADSWASTRRAEILRDFQGLMYGHTPVLPVTLRSEVVGVRKDAVGGLATRTLVRLRFFDDPAAPTIDLALYTPNASPNPVPVFLGLSFYGNASVEEDPAIPLPSGWMRPHRTPGVVEDHRATESLRGISSHRWPLAAALRSGYGVATFYSGDVEPDHIDGWRDGIRGYALKLSGQTEFAVDDWGMLGAWAWGLSRTLDYLETEPLVDASRVAVFGHSRMGKAALWAGVQDERFALVISNNSGEGGASLARRNFGENIAYSIAHASWRYCGRFPNYIGRASELPFDQHLLLALVAPRPLYVCSATEDGLADPKGEFLSALNAGPVYQLYGLGGVEATEWPPPDKPVGQTIGYHLRTGGHDITPYDWEQFLAFADRHLRAAATR